jgi:hypothetical protein
LVNGEDETHRQVNEILRALKGAGVIKGKVGTTFNLTHSELLVNGVRQPAALHAALKEKFIYKQGDFINFYCDGSRTDIGTHRE